METMSNDLLETPEDADLRAFVRSFANDKIDHAYLRDCDTAKRFPVELWDEMSAAGLHGIAIDEEYGGSGGGVMQQAIVVEELARVMGGMTTSWSINTHAALTISEHGTPEQKADRLTKMVAGGHRVGLAISEPAGGTDVLGVLSTTAKPVDGGFLVNGSKMWTTMADDCHELMLLAKSGDGPKKTDGLTYLFCDPRADGITRNRLDTLGQRALGTFQVFFDDVFVPDHNVIGEVDKGWVPLTTCITQERIIIAALCTGVIQGVIEQVVEYAKDRVVFGNPIGQYQAVQHHIANMEISRQAARGLYLNAARLCDAGIDYVREASIAKCFASEACSTAADLGIQILGGAGYLTEMNIERYWRDTRIMRIGPLANEVIRNQVAESLGLPRSR
jgi:alkylation response protein AidB-like acyl-CoA dehydrogenase